MQGCEMTYVSRSTACASDATSRHAKAMAAMYTARRAILDALLAARSRGLEVWCECYEGLLISNDRFGSPS